jgi:hypothetical protein
MKTVTVCKSIDWPWFSLLLPVSHYRFGVSTDQTVTPNNTVFSLCLSVAPTKCVSERMSDTATETDCQTVESPGLWAWGRHEIRKQIFVNDASWQFKNPSLPMKRLTKSKWGIVIFFKIITVTSLIPLTLLCGAVLLKQSVLLPCYCPLTLQGIKACRQNYWINMITSNLLSVSVHVLITKLEIKIFVFG